MSLCCEGLRRKKPTLKWSRGLFPGVGTSSSLVPPAIGVDSVRSPVLTRLLLLPLHNGNFLSCCSRSTGGVSHWRDPPLLPQEPPLKLMAITEEQMKGTAMVTVTRPLLQEQSRSTWGKKLSSACKALSWQRLGMGTHYSQFLTEQEPAKRFRVSVYFLLRPGRKKLFL